MTLNLAAEPHVVVGPNRRADFELCPRRYRNKQLLHLAGLDEMEGAGTVRGQAVHEELHHRHEIASLHDEDEPQLAGARDLRDPLVARALATHRRVCPGARGARYLGGELTLLWAPPRERLLVHGRIDALWEWPGGVLEIRDYKTGATGDDLSLDFSARVYALLVAADPRWRGGRRIIRVTFERLLDDPVEVSIDADAPFLRDAVEAVRSFARRLREESEWPAKPSEFCGRCRYRESCPSSAAG